MTVILEKFEVVELLFWDNPGPGAQSMFPISTIFIFKRFAHDSFGDMHTKNEFQTTA